MNVEDKYTKKEYRVGEEVEFEDKRAEEILSKRLNSGELFAIEVQDKDEEINKDADENIEEDMSKEAEVETAIEKPNKRNTKKYNAKK